MKLSTIHPFLLIGLLAVTALSCIREQEPEIAPDQEREVQLTATIADQALTRGVSLDENGVVCSWSVGDELALVKDNVVISTLRVTSVSGGKAQLTGRVKGAYRKDTPMTLYYGGTSYDYSGQDGTAGSAASKAYLKAETKIAMQNNETLVLAPVTLEHQQAYFSFTFLKGQDPLNVTELQITGGGSQIVKTLPLGGNTTSYDNDNFTVTSSEGVATMYFALFDENTSEHAYTLSIKDADGHTHTANTASLAYARANYYVNTEVVLDKTTDWGTAPTLASPATLLYDEAAHDLMTSGTTNAEDVVLYYGVSAASGTEPAAADWGTDVPQRTEPGTYYAWYKVEGGKYYQDVAATELGAFTISQRSVSVTAPTAVVGLAYTGSSQALVNPGTIHDASSEHFADGLVMKYYVDSSATKRTPVPAAADLPSNATWSTDIPRGTNALYYYVWYKVEGSDHYEGTEVAGAVEVTIAKAEAVVVPPAAIAGLNVILDGNDQPVQQNLVLPGSAPAGLTMQYYMNTTGTLPSDPSPWTTTVPTAANKGDYYVWYRAVLTENVPNNYLPLGPTGPIYVSIGKSPCAIVPPQAQTGLQYQAETTAPYAGVAQNLLAQAAQVVDGDKIITTGYGITLYYRVTTTNVRPLSTPAEDWKTTAEATEVGTYYIWTKAEADEASTYASVDVSLTSVQVSISKINIPDAQVVAPVTATSLKYTGTAQQLIATAGSSPETTTMQYMISDTQPSASASGWTTDVTSLTATNAGTYKVWYQVAGGNNYNDWNVRATSYVTVTIDKATLTAVADDKSRQYGEENPELTVTVIGFKNGETAATAAGYVAPTASTTATITTPVGGYEINVSGGSADNYTFIYAGGILEIVAANPTLNAEPTIISAALTYTGSDQELLSAAGTATGGTITYGASRYAAETDSPATPNEWYTDYTSLKGQNAGYYYIYVKVDGDGNHSDKVFGPITGSPKQIEKATPVVTPPTAKTGLEYTGSAQELISPGSTTFGTLEYAVVSYQPAANHTSWNPSVPTRTNAGTYHVWTKVDASDNWNAVDVSSTSVDVTIAKAAPTLTSLPVAKTESLVYTGSAQALLQTAATVSHGTAYYQAIHESVSTTAPGPNDGTWSTNIANIKGTEAGKYYIWTKIVGSTNYSTIVYETPVTKDISYPAPTGFTVTAGSTGAISYSGSNASLLQYRVYSGTNPGSWSSYSSQISSIAPGKTYEFRLHNDNVADGPTTVITIVANNYYISVDLGTDVYWADRNLGATNPQNGGGYYSWGMLKGDYGEHFGDKAYYTSANYSAPGSGNVENGVLKLAKDPANQELGGKWRMPTKEEFQELSPLIYRQHSYPNEYVIWGRNNYPDITMFVPLVGYIYDGLHYWSVTGRYWTRSKDSSGAYYTNFVSTGTPDPVATQDEVYYGCQIRPVWDPTL